MKPLLAAHVSGGPPVIPSKRARCAFEEKGRVAAVFAPAGEVCSDRRAYSSRARDFRKDASKVVLYGYWYEVVRSLE